MIAERKKAVKIRSNQSDVSLATKNFAIRRQDIQIIQRKLIILRSPLESFEALNTKVEFPNWNKYLDLS